jgi:long-subunit acyl-CoA synthetase (AMP-forming)
MRGEFVFAGYVQGRRFTEQFFTRDGWFKTGDLAVMDSDGYIRIAGRSKDSRRVFQGSLDPAYARLESRNVENGRTVYE